MWFRLEVLCLSTGKSRKKKSSWEKLRNKHLYQMSFWLPDEVEGQKANTGRNCRTLKSSLCSAETHNAKGARWRQFSEPRWSCSGWFQFLAGKRKALRSLFTSNTPGVFPLFYKVTLYFLKWDLPWVEIEHLSAMKTTIVLNGTWASFLGNAPSISVHCMCLCLLCPPLFCCCFGLWSSLALIWVEWCVMRLFTYYLTLFVRVW